MEDKNGYAKFHRSILDWEWYREPNTSRLFFHLVLKAHWKDSRFQGHEVPRGSLVTGRKVLAAELGMSEREVRTAMEHLKQTGEITVKSTNKFTIVTVVKYCDFQDVDTNERPTNDQQLTNKRPTNDQQLTTYEERKKVRKKEGKNNNTPLTPQRGTEEIPIPTVLDFDRFKEAWRDWVAYRKEKRQTLKESTIKIQFRFLAEHSSDAVEIIEQSIRNGWTGLFELKQPRRTEPQPTKTVTLSERQRINEEFLREDG